MLRCTTPTNIIKINLSPSVIKSLTVLYAQNKCALLEKNIPIENIFPSKSDVNVCYARVDLAQVDTAAFANVASGRVEIQVVAQTFDNAVLYSHIMQAEIGSVLKDLIYEDAIAGTGQLDIDYDEFFPTVEANLDTEFGEVFYVSHPYSGLKNDDLEVVVNNDDWTIGAVFSETFRQKNVAKLKFTVDPKTYVLKIALLNSEGEEIASDEQDLPIEKAFIGISWEPKTHTLLFKTESGETIPVQLADIVTAHDVEELYTTLSQEIATAVEWERNRAMLAEREIAEDLLAISREIAGEEERAQRQRAIWQVQLRMRVLKLRKIYKPQKKVCDRQFPKAAVTNW